MNFCSFYNKICDKLDYKVEIECYNSIYNNFNTSYYNDSITIEPVKSNDSSVVTVDDLFSSINLHRCDFDFEHKKDDFWKPTFDSVSINILKIVDCGDKTLRIFLN